MFGVAKRYVIVQLNDDFGMLKRTVYEDPDGKRYIKVSTGKLYLDAIRGSYRYI